MCVCVCAQYMYMYVTYHINILAVAYIKFLTANIVNTANMESKMALESILENVNIKNSQGGGGGDMPPDPPPPPPSHSCFKEAQLTVPPLP